MPKRWSKKEELQKYNELERLYVRQNRSIGEIAKILSLGQSTIYDRLLRLDIKTNRNRKARFNNKRNDISIPKNYSEKLSEFIGIMLGDGHLTPTQITVTLGNKEKLYVHYVAKLISNIFGIKPKIIKTDKGYYVVYFGSTNVVRWLQTMGLAFNKVKNQVNVPFWITSKNDYIISFLRGFFDTDGSIYQLRFGTQIAFTNKSLPMLKSVKHSLLLLGFSPSRISLFRIYLTRRKDVLKFFKLVKPANTKHQKRFKMLRV